MASAAWDVGAEVLAWGLLVGAFLAGRWLFSRGGRSTPALRETRGMGRRRPRRGGEWSSPAPRRDVDRCSLAALGAVNRNVRSSLAHQTQGHPTT